MTRTSTLATDAFVLFGDLQEGIVDHGRTNDRTSLDSAVGKLAKIAQIYRLPVIVTTIPGPDGGPATLIPALRDVLGDVTPLQRTTTSAFDNTAIVEAIAATGRHTMLVAGCATEIMVQRAALAAVDDDYAVQIVLDACSGFAVRSEEASLRRLVAAGVVLTSVPSVVGELAGDFSTSQAGQALGVLLA